MNRLLTQDEYEALCQRMQRPACSSPARAVAGTARGRRAQTFDFRRPNPVRRQQLRRLETLHEQLAHAIGGALCAELRLSVQAELGAVEQLTYSEFQSALPPVSGSFLFRCTPLNGTCVMTLDPTLCSVLLNRVFGGSGEPEPGIRELTSIERRGLLCLIDSLRAEMESHWQRASGRSVGVTSFEELPRLAEPAAPGATVISVTLAIRLPGVAGTLRLCYPHEILVLLSTGSDARSPRPMAPGERRVVIEQQLRQARLPVSVRLATVNVALGRLAALRPGRIIELKYTATDRVQVLLHGQTRYVAAIGHVGRRRAVKIQQPTR